jgi:hypothetical protein
LIVGLNPPWNHPQVTFLLFKRSPMLVLMKEALGNDFVAGLKQLCFLYSRRCD